MARPWEQREEDSASVRTAILCFIEEALVTPMMRSSSGIYVAWRELLLPFGRGREVPRVLLSCSWSWSMQPGGVRGGDRHWGGADGVSEGTHLLGVAKLEYVSGRVSELLPSIQE